jgi:hypothetical protein
MAPRRAPRLLISSAARPRVRRKPVHRGSSFAVLVALAGALQLGATLVAGCGDNDCAADDGACVSAGYGGAAGYAGTGGSAGTAGSVDPGLGGTGGTAPVSTGSGIFCSPGAANQCAPGTTCCSSNGQCSEIGQTCPF